MDNDFIRLVRRRTGLTQSALAEFLDVDQGTVSRWERGLVTPRPSNLAAMRSLLLKDEERRVRDRSLSLLRCNLVPATLIDQKTRLVEASELVKNHIRSRTGKDVRRMIGMTLTEYADRGGVPGLADHVARSGLLSGDALLFRFVVNRKGKGHVTVYEPVLEDGEVTAILNYVTTYFDFPPNDELSLELVECVLAEEPTRLHTLHSGERADLIELVGA